MKKVLLSLLAMAAITASANVIATDAVVSTQNVKQATPEMVQKLMAKTTAAARVKSNITTPVTKASDLEGTYTWDWKMTNAVAQDVSAAVVSSTGTQTVLFSEANDEAGTVKISGMLDGAFTGTLDLTTYDLPTVKLGGETVTVAYVTYSGASVTCWCSVKGLFYYEGDDNNQAGWYFTDAVAFAQEDGTLLWATNVYLTRYIERASNTALNGYRLNPVWIPGSTMTALESQTPVGTMDYTYNEVDMSNVITYTQEGDVVTINNFAAQTDNPVLITLSKNEDGEGFVWNLPPTVLFTNTNGTFTTAPIYDGATHTGEDITGVATETTLTSSTNWTAYDAETNYWIGNRDPFTIYGKFTMPGATAIKDVNTDKAVKSVKYVNLAGQQSNMPFDGVNIVINTYSDGTTSASKVIK